MLSDDDFERPQLRGLVHDVRVRLNDPDIMLYWNSVMTGQPIYVSTGSWTGRAFITHMRLLGEEVEVTVTPTGAPHAQPR